MKQNAGFQKIFKWARHPLVAFIAMILIANAIFVWITGSRLEEQLAAIRAAGDPVSKTDLVPEPIPLKDNAAIFLGKALEDCKAIDSEFYDSCKDWYIDREYPMPARVQKTLEDILETHASAFPLLKQAAACQSYNAGLDYSLPHEEFCKHIQDNVVGYRDCARALWHRAELQAAQGKYDEVVKTSLVLLSLSRHFGENPFILDSLVASVLDGMAIHSANLAMQTGQVSKPIRNMLDAELALHKPLESMLRALKTERAYGFDQRRISGVRPFWFIARPICNWHAARFLESYNEYIRITANPGSYALDKVSLDKISMEIGVIGLHENVARAQAQFRSLRVLIALQINEATGSGNVPDLDKLGLPVETTIDPFTGKPLHVKKTSQGWIVYSVGPNMKDNGGRVLGYNGVNSGDWDIGVCPVSAAVSKDSSPDK